MTPIPCPGVRQQKCMARVIRSIGEVVQTKVGRGRSFGKRLVELLRESIELRELERCVESRWTLWVSLSG